MDEIIYVLKTIYTNVNITHIASQNKFKTITKN